MIRKSSSIIGRYKVFRGQAGLMFRALRHPRTPAYARIVAMLTLVYLLSPIDLVPDYIPIAGWIDDLIIAPLIFGFALKLIPQSVVEEVTRTEKAGKKIYQRVIFWIGLLLLTILILWLINRQNA